MRIELTGNNCAVHSEIVPDLSGCSGEQLKHMGLFSMLSLMLLSSGVKFGGSIVEHQNSKFDSTLVGVFISVCWCVGESIC